MTVQSDRDNATTPRYCAVPVLPLRVLPPTVSAHRARAIIALDSKWTNGTILHYYFFDQETDGRTLTDAAGGTEWRPWTTTDDEKNVVREAFEVWANVGIGLQFVEVTSRSEAEIRIGFERDDGAWSYVGRDVLDIGTSERTMNFGWDLLENGRDIDTAIHEIGHTIGLPHEHQNPISGIVWDEEAVYRSLGGHPNFWSRETTYHNIIRKISPDEVQGSSWDPDSIMEYPFEPGLILKPEGFYKTGVRPPGGLSSRDRSWVRRFYPPLDEQSHRLLRPFEAAPLDLDTGEQANFVIEPAETRNYNFRTFGASDVVMVLFEDVAGEWRYVAGDDDSGEERNTEITAKLFAGRRYALRVRLYTRQGTEVAVMMW